MAGAETQNASGSGKNPQNRTNSPQKSPPRGPRCPPPPLYACAQTLLPPPPPRQPLDYACAAQHHGRPARAHNAGRKTRACAQHRHDSRRMRTTTRGPLTVPVLGPTAVITALPTPPPRKQWSEQPEAPPGPFGTFRCHFRAHPTFALTSAPPGRKEGVPRSARPYIARHLATPFPLGITQWDRAVPPPACQWLKPPAGEHRERERPSEGGAILSGGRGQRGVLLALRGFGVPSALLWPPPTVTPMALCAPHIPPMAPISPPWPPSYPPWPPYPPHGPPVTPPWPPIIPP